MLVGYVRVSTEDQNLDLQLDELTARGCQKIFSEKISGAQKDRPELEKALEFVRPGDGLVVWRVDRLGRSVLHLIEIIDRLDREDIDFISLTEGFDTTSAHGRLIFQIVASFSEFERTLLRERTLAGLAAARARGRKGGRPPKLSETQVNQARVLAANPQCSIAQICDTYGISPRTYYRRIAPSCGGRGSGR